MTSETRRQPRSARRAAATTALPITRSTSDIAAKLAGSICAAQPVTTICADGRSRRVRRIATRVAFTTATVIAAAVDDDHVPPATSAPWITFRFFGDIGAATQTDDVGTGLWRSLRQGRWHGCDL